MGQKIIGILNALLKGELSAVDAYTKLLERTVNSEIGLELTELRHCHARRVRKLSRWIRKADEKPALQVSPAFSFAPFDHAANDAVVLKLLAQFEELALHEYSAALAELDELTKAFVQDDLLPDQEATLSVVNTLRDGIGLLVKTA